MTTLWPWLSLAGLGAFHGVNPAMGWLFAVALGLHRQSRRTVWLSLVPIAIGHAISIACVLAVFVAFGTALDPNRFRIAAAMLILGSPAIARFMGTATASGSECKPVWSALRSGPSLWRRAMEPA